MATYSQVCSNVGNFTYGNRFTLYVVLTNRDGDPATNKSWVDYNVYFENTSGGGTFTSQTRLYFALNGGVIKDSTSSITGPRNGSVSIASGSVQIEHSNDGTKSIGYHALVQSNSFGIKGEISGTFTLSTIPRASSVSGGSGNIGGTSKITVTRASSSFTHTLRYSFGSLSGNIATGVGTSHTWTIPTSFYAQVPNAKSKTGTIYCDTYNGSTLVGTKSITFTATVTESSSRPTVTGTVVDTNQTTINLTGNANKLILGKSTAKITASPSAKNSATIKTVKIDGTTTTNNTKTIANVSKASFPIEVTDSRGFTNTAYSATPSGGSVTYVPLTFKADIFRPQPTGTEIKMTYSGNYFKGSFGAITNTLSITWKYRVQGASGWTNGGTITPTFNGNTIASKTVSLGTNYNYQTAYEFQIVAVDKLTTITQTIPVSVGMPVFYWGKEFLKVTKKLIVDGEIVKNDGYLPVYRGATTNFNEALTHGFYSFSGTNIEGSPVSSQVYGTLEVIVQHSQTWVASNYSLFIWQIYRDTTGKEFHRFGVNEETMSGWRRIYKETTLYNNTSGTGGTITLSETSANFSYIEIFFENSTNGYESVKVYSPNGKIATLTSSYYDGAIYLFTKRITISGTSITNKDYGQVWMSNGGTANITAENKFSIVKVVGYR